MPPVKRVLSHRWQPDLIVGIDFGMTCTGVVYARLNSESASIPEIKQIKRWPGARDQVLEKVPTELRYDGESGTVDSWGAECRRNIQGSERTKRWFKLVVPAQTTKVGVDSADAKRGLASDSNATLNEQHDGDSARRYFKDYITQVCSWSDSTLEDQVPRFKSLNAEYVFSIPTSWSLETSTLHTISSLIREAVSESQTRRARVGLTEAAAAAVDTGRDSCRKGDVVLVIDTGGGTTDINIFKYLSSEGEPARIKAMTYDEGEDIGSTRIDQSCLAYLNSRLLETIDKDAASTWLDYAAVAIRENWADLKHSYGDSTSVSDSYYHLQIGPSRSPSDFAAHRSPSPDLIPPKEGRGCYTFRIPARVMQQWFDDQITAITLLIDKQISKLQLEHKREKVSRIVLSGGFALNKYYRSQLRNHFNERIRAKDKGISDDLEILNAAEPHLAVVRGLVYNRCREVMGLGPMYESVVSPTSFGFVVSEEYSKMKHGSLGEVPVTSMLNGKQWIRGQIDWVVEEGIPIPSKGLKKEYDIVLHSENEGMPQTFQVVSCDNPRKNLPKNINHVAVKPVCEIKIDVSKLAIERTKRKFSLSRSKDKQWAETREARFDLWILTGAADLRFEVKPRGEDDSLISLEHDQIDIAWANPQERELARVTTAPELMRDVIVRKSFRQSLSLRSPSFT